MSGRRERTRRAWAAFALLALAGCGRYSNYRLVPDEGAEAGPDGADSTSMPPPEAGPDATDAADVADAMDAPDVADVTDATDAMDAMDAAELMDVADAMDAPDATDVIDAMDAADASDARDAADVTDAADVVDSGPDAGAPEPLELVSVSASGGAADGPSVAGFHVVSDDGRYVVFTSRATNLVSPPVVFPSERVELVYLRDLQLRTTTLLSRRIGDPQPVPNAPSYDGAISGDGSTVVFVTRATNIDPGGATTPNDDVRLYRWRRATGALDLITAEADGVTPFSLIEGNGPILSRDGRHLFFSTRTRADLRAPRPRTEFNGFYVDLSQPAATRTFVLVTVGTTGMLPQFPPSEYCSSERPGGGANTGLLGISSDGRFAVAYTNAVGLVPGDSDGCADTYVFERGTTNTRRAINTSGMPASLRSFAIDDTGNNAVIETLGPLGLTDTDALQDIYYGPLVGTSWRRVTEPLAGRPNDGQARRGRIDAAARRVLFTSTSSALVAGDTNNAADLFVRDLITNTTTRVSTYDDGGQIDYRCTSIATCTADVAGELSGDGRNAVFTSNVALAATGDANGDADVYLRRLDLPLVPRPELDLVSVSASGTAAGDGTSFVSLSHSITADGRYVVFTSDARNLVSPAIAFSGPAYRLVYLRDLVARTTTLISRTPAGELPNALAEAPSISRDGSVIAFATAATNMGDGPFGAHPDPQVRFYVWRRATGRTELAVADATGRAIDCVHGSTTVLSATGQYLSFATRTIVTAAAPRGAGEVNSYITDLTVPLGTRTNELLTRSTSGGFSMGVFGVECGPDGRAEGANTWVGDLSPNGRFALAPTAAVNLVPGDRNGCTDSYRFERGTNNTVRIDPRPAGSVGHLVARSIDDTGTFTLIEARAALDGGPSNGQPNVYLGSIGTTSWRRVSVAMGGALSNGPSSAVAVDAARRRVLFYSAASNLVPNDTNNAMDLFVRDLASNTTTRVSTAADGRQLHEGCTTCPPFVFGDISADGRYAVFDTTASAVGALDANGAGDVYVRRLR